MDAGQLSGAAIAKRLASCNQPARSRAVRLLTRWLPLQSSAADSLSDGDLIKIWKGLFYSVWHADKLPFQLDLINRLSALLETLDSDLAVRYFESFLVTIRREWSGIDHLRLDKFYLLIRKFIRRFFALLKKNDWNVDLLNRLVSVLSEKSLLAADKYEASGVNFHISEVFLDEIEVFLPIKPEILDSLLRPFVLVLERSSNRVLVTKIRANVFEKLAQNGVKYFGGERNGEVDKFGRYALVLGFSEKFLKSASDEGTVQGNRKVLFGLHDRFLKLEDLEKSRLEISFEDLDNGSEAQKVEPLVSENGNEDGELDARPVMKRKKEKKASSGVEKKSKAKKKRNESSGSAADSKGSIDVTFDGENGIESNGAETKSGTGKKKKKKKNLKDSAVERHGGIVGNNELINSDETIVSNLEKQFEKVAAEAGVALPVIPIAVAKKRKRAKSADKLATVSNIDSKGESIAAKSGDESVKKVRFSMKNNLVWKPQAPLPPQSLRLPPSATPRGSALKKGVPPGPIKQTPPMVKRIKANGGSVKKVRKSLKSVFPAVKRLRKLQTLSV